MNKEMLEVVLRMLDMDVKAIYNYIDFKVIRKVSIKDFGTEQPYPIVITLYPNESCTNTFDLMTDVYHPALMKYSSYCNREEVEKMLLEILKED